MTTGAGCRGRRPGPRAAVAAGLVVVLAGSGCSAERATADPVVTNRSAAPSPKVSRPAPASTARAAPAPGPPAKPVPVGPSITGDFPDPDILRHDGTYYAYATNSRGRNVPMATAPSPAGPWTVLAQDALPTLGGWAKPGYTWAPEIARRPDGVFVLFYTAASRRTGDQCVGVATARSPRGPFRPVGAPIVCSAHGDAIDAAYFRDKDGESYLLYRADRPGPRPTAIFIRRLGEMWLGFKGPATRILTWDDSDPILVEAPSLVRHRGKYVLFYSSGVFYSDNYRTRYAVSGKLTGPYRRAPGTLLSTDAYDRVVVGPGGADVIRDGAKDHIVFHGITENRDRRVTRSMYVATLGWDGSRPVVRGVPRRYEGERGDPVAGKTVKRPRASGDRAIDLHRGPASSLDLRVFAPEAGVYTARLRYRPKGPRMVRAVLSVRSSPQDSGSSELHLRYGGDPLNWPVAEAHLTLRAGWNTLTLRGLTAAVEIDHVEIR